MSKLPSLTELEIRRLKPAEKKDALSYVRHRVRTLKRAKKKFQSMEEYDDFLFGRLTEAEQIRDFLVATKGKK